MALPLSSRVSQISQLKMRLAIGRIDDAGVAVLAVEGEDVVLGDRAPVHVAGIVDVGPALDAGEQTLDARAVAADAIAIDMSRR